MTKEHQHNYVPLRVAYVHTADNLPDFFMAKIVCLVDDCDEEYVAIQEASEA